MNSYVALVEGRDKENDEPADAPPPEPDAVSPVPVVDLEGTVPAPPERYRAPAELAAEERAMDMCAASAKTERRL